MSWGASAGGHVRNDSAFLFSFDNKKKYNVNTPNYAIYCHNQYGPIFGNGHDIYLSNYAPQNNTNTTNGCAYPLETKNELNKGKSNFTPISYEVYQIKYPE